MGGSGDLFPKSPKRYNDMVFHNMSGTFKAQGSSKLKQSSNLEMNQTLEPADTIRQSSLKKVLLKHKNIKSKRDKSKIKKHRKHNSHV